MSNETDKTSAVETLRDAMTTRNGCDYFAMGAEDYRALLDRLMDAPTDADGNLLHVGDEVTFRTNTEVLKIYEFRFGRDGWFAHSSDYILRCSSLHKVMPDSRERIEADAKLSLAEYCAKRGIGGLPDCNTKPLDLVRRCFALVDGEKR